MELHKEHHSRSAGLNQRLAAAETEEWSELVERAYRKQQEEEDKKNERPNHVEDDQAYLRKVNRAIFKANSGHLRAAKQIVLGSKQATPGEETTRMIKAKIPEDDLSERQWARMNEEIEECRRLAWIVQHPSKKKDNGQAGHDEERGRAR